MILRLLLALLIPLFIGGATNPPADEARAAFGRLPVQERLDIQALLAVAGYWNSVASDAFGPKLMGAMQEFQINGGYKPTGILTPGQYEALRREATPLLEHWRLTPARLPSLPATLWVPSGLGLKRTEIDFGLMWEGLNDDISITFTSVRAKEINYAYKLMRSTLDDEGFTIGYEISRRDFFVITAVKGNRSTYIRYHLTNNGIVGFTTHYEDAADLHGDRLVVLMSDLLRASIDGKPRTPPSPSNGAKAVERPRHMTTPEILEGIAGSWRTEGELCEAPIDSDGRPLMIQGRTFRFYEAVCQLKNARMVGNTLRGTLACEGEGETWTEELIHDRQMPEMSIGGRIYVECPKM